MPLLHALLQPPPRPRVAYGSGVDGYGGVHNSEPWDARLGRRRLIIIDLFTTLISTRRPPLTAALAEVKPSFVPTAVSLLLHHRSSSILGVALVRLVDAALQAKPVRQALLHPTAQGETLATLIVSGLSPALQATSDRALDASRPVWMELVAMLEKASASDKQV